MFYENPSSFPWNSSYNILLDILPVFPYIHSTGSAAPQTAGALGCRIIVTNTGGFSDIVSKDPKVSKFCSVSNPNKDSLADNILKEIELFDPNERDIIKSTFKTYFSTESFQNCVLQSLID